MFRSVCFVVVRPVLHLECIEEKKMETNNVFCNWLIDFGKVFGVCAVCVWITMYMCARAFCCPKPPPTPSPPPHKNALIDKDKNVKFNCIHCMHYECTVCRIVTAPNLLQTFVQKWKNINIFSPTVTAVPSIAKIGRCDFYFKKK